MRGIVWGLDRPTCGGKLDTLITEYEVIFENGDIWRAVVATESSRGRKCNISLVDSRIPYEYMPIIECSTTCPPFHAISYY